MKNNSKQSIKNKDAEGVFKKWKQGKGDLIADIKKDSIMFKRGSTVNKPIWTNEQSEYLDNKFGAIDKRFETQDKKLDMLIELIKDVSNKLDKHISDDHQK